MNEKPEWVMDIDNMCLYVKFANKWYLPQWGTDGKLALVEDEHPPKGALLKQIRDEIERVDKHFLLINDPLYSGRSTNRITIPPKEE